MSGDANPTRDGTHDNAPKPRFPNARAAQREIIDHRARFRIAVCGRRFGKTVAAGIAAVEQCEQAAERQHVWWISPIQEQSDRVEREIAFWLAEKTKRRGAKLPQDNEHNNGKDPSDVWEHHKSEHALVYLGNGSRIEFHSAHAPDHLRGAGLNLVIIDEAADVNEYAWKHVLKPMLLESQGRALILGTPRGTNNWLHKLFLLGRQPEHAKTYGSFQKKSADNPDIRPADLDEYRLEMTELEFRQEFDAEFVDGAGSVFPTVLECVSGETLPYGRLGKLYVTGIDLGEHQDYTVICSVSFGDERLEGFWRFHQIGWNEQLVRIREHLRRFPGPCVIDATGVGDPIVQQMMRVFPSRVHPFRISAQSKNEIVKGLGMALEQKCLKLANEPQLIAELQSFQRLDDGSPSGLPRYGAPKGLHDDGVIALALAWWGLKSGKWGGNNGNVVSGGFFA